MTWICCISCIVIDSMVSLEHAICNQYINFTRYILLSRLCFEMYSSKFVLWKVVKSEWGIVPKPAKPKKSFRCALKWDLVYNKEKWWIDGLLSNTVDLLAVWSNPFKRESLHNTNNVALVFFAMQTQDVRS